MSTALEDAVRALHTARIESADLCGEVKRRQAVFDTENAALIQNTKEAVAAVEAADRAVRALVSSHYTATGEAKPCPGVEVKEYTTFGYDEAQALTWAREKQMALRPESLDVKAFEKIARVTPIDFVYQIVEPRVSIATDLSKVLPPLPVVVSDGADAGFEAPF